MGVRANSALPASVVTQFVTHCPAGIVSVAVAMSFAALGARLAVESRQTGRSAHAPRLVVLPYRARTARTRWDTGCRFS
jgi:hypothetical protein